eukprot:TRINITY_DN191692_c0_g1_i1.p1 TRINITY_DN191692_c0_g1~~TRINITY_DN191692_c0_g1_i1.p1  ORF type:complete len:265 (+),score=25.98 TRINITY_DN191692_c0_g1_i1:99-797(+)
MRSKSGAIYRLGRKLSNHFGIAERNPFPFARRVTAIPTIAKKDHTAFYNYWANNQHKRDGRSEEDLCEMWRAEFQGLRRYKDDELLKWREVFDKFDPDNDGFISQADLQKFRFFTVEKAQLIKDYDRDRNNLIDFGEFVDAMRNVDTYGLRKSFEGFEAVDLQLQFAEYAVPDVDGAHHGKQHLNLESVKKMMTSAGFTVVTDTDAQFIFESVRGSSAGIFLSEFHKWLGDQ